MANVNLQVEVAGLDEALSKARQINDMVKEARTLAGELASELDRLEVKVNDQPTDKIEVEELEDKGFITFRGKVPRKYFEERTYGS